MIFDYSPITERPPIQWPGGAKVAVYVGLNVEHFHLDKPSTSIWSGTADLVPDALNLSFHPQDGHLLATAADDETVRLWDTATGQPVGDPLTGHTGPVWAVAFHPAAS
ncbi:hypothetical protein [Streptosporangium sp. NPDC049046]|uniref:hypothetical protein n=1 Tax=Streptosporangium sp. NPDC049046 TaxID=3155031 RepID=UPI003426D950